jgi:hypothetical protein
VSRRQILAELNGYGGAADAPAAKRQRAEFIRQAVKEAIRRREYEHIREAYLRQPDTCSDVDDWSNAEEWKG